MSKIYAESIIQFKYKNQTMFSARFETQDEDDQVLDKIELHNNLSFIHF